MTPAARQAARAAVVARAPERAHDLGYLRRETLRALIQAAGDNPSQADAAFEAFLAARQRVTLYDEVAPVLSRWSQRYRLIAVSNGNGDIARIGIGHWFSASVAAHELPFAKPDPRIYLEACRRAGVAPADVLHIGDDLDLDVRAATAAGLQAVWLRRADRAHPPLSDAAGIDVFEDLRALDAHLHPDGAG